MVPTLKIPRGELLGNGFINGFSKDEMKEEHYPDSVFVLFRPQSLTKFRKFLDSEYERTKSVIEDYDYPKGFVVVVYKLDPYYKEDFDLVRQSKYSKTSKEFQKEFPKTVILKTTWSESEEISLQYRVFNKTEDLALFWEKQFDVTLPKEQELWRAYEEEKETLTQSKLEVYGRQRINETTNK